MASYTLLEEHLQKKSESEISFCFADIEEIIGTALPPSARKHRAWWSNSAASSNMAVHAWRNAGYRTKQVDMAGEKLIFFKDETMTEKQMISKSEKSGGKTPLFGALKGFFTIADGVDLTEPAYPEWADMAEGKWAGFHEETNK